MKVPHQKKCLKSHKKSKISPKLKKIKHLKKSSSKYKKMRPLMEEEVVVMGRYSPKSSHKYHHSKKSKHFRFPNKNKLSFFDEKSTTSDETSSECDFDFNIGEKKSLDDTIILSSSDDESLIEGNVSSDNENSFNEDCDDNSFSLNERLDETLLSAEEKSEKISEMKDTDTVLNILTFTSSKYSCFIFAIAHPMTLKISGVANIKVISGSANILGYDLDATKDFVSIYSVPEVCNLSIETKFSLTKNIHHRREIFNSLDGLVEHNVIQAIMSTVNDSHVLLLVFPKNDKSGPYFANSFFNRALCLPKKDKEGISFADYGFNLSDDDDSTIKLSEVHHEVADTIRQHMRSFVDNNGPVPCVFIYGKKNTGKSMALKYFVNKLLAQCVQRVFVLDADPGQSEFTVAGCISLTEVKNPLLGPSYTHLQTPKICKFVGEFALDASASYFNYLHEVMEYYKDNYANEILLINTAGYVTGCGKYALETIQTYLKPTIEVELVYESDLMKAQKRSCLFQEPNYPRKFIIPSYVCSRDRRLLPGDLRKISVLSYFGTLQHYWEKKIASFNSFEPYCVSATDLAIHILNSEENDAQKIRILNASVVALCSVDPSQILHCADNSEPKRLQKGSNFGNCIGFGFVRAVDVENKLLYLVTPVSITQLKSVNALIKGKLELPSCVFANQAMLSNTSLPYMSSSLKSKKWSFGKKIQRRYFHPK